MDEDDSLLLMYAGGRIRREAMMPFREMREGDFVVIDGPATVLIKSVKHGRIKVFIDCARDVAVSPVQLVKPPARKARLRSRREKT